MPVDGPETRLTLPGTRASSGSLSLASTSMVTGVSSSVDTASSTTSGGSLHQGGLPPEGRSRGGAAQPKASVTVTTVPLPSGMPETVQVPPVPGVAVPAEALTAYGAPAPPPTVSATVQALVLSQAMLPGTGARVTGGNSVSGTGRREALTQPLTVARVSAYQVPAAGGTKLVPAPTGLPPVAVAYQSTAKPAPGSATPMATGAAPAQRLSPVPSTGEGTAGQGQLSAVSTTPPVSQPSASVTVTFRSVPAGMPETVNAPPPRAVTA